MRSKKRSNKFYRPDSLKDNANLSERNLFFPAECFGMFFIPVYRGPNVARCIANTQNIWKSVMRDESNEFFISLSIITRRETLRKKLSNTDFNWRAIFWTLLAFQTRFV